MSNKRKKKQSLTKEERRRRRRRRAAFWRLFLVLALVSGTVFGVAQVSKSIEVPLVVNADNYLQITDETEAEDTETLDHAEAVSGELSYAVVQPRLREEYPIETVLQSEYAIVYDVQADEVLFAKTRRNNAILPALQKF